MIGHEKILNDLKRLAKSEALGQGYLFHGPSMVGKKAAALAFAKFLEKGEFVFPHGGEVLTDAKLIDFAFMQELDAKAKDSIGIDASREMKAFLSQKPIVSPRRTLIIDDAEMLTAEAQNALLKVVEEPPASSFIIFIASDPESILSTILSRLQKVYFGSVSGEAIEDWLVVSHGVPTEKAATAAKRALGKPGLAWRMLFDETFRDDLALAQKYLTVSLAERKDFVKELVAPESFRLRRFIEMVILALASDPNLSRHTVLWHKTLALQEVASSFGVNPRIQLESLLM